MKTNLRKEAILILAEMYIKEETGISVNLNKKDLHTIYKINYMDEQNNTVFSEKFAVIGNRIFELPEYIDFTPTFRDTIQEVGDIRAHGQYTPKICIINLE